MKLYNTGTEIFSFTHGGIEYTILPKLGTFVRGKEKYVVEGLRDMVRFKDVWVKESDEGVNSNFVEAPTEHAARGLALANQTGREDIKHEGEVVKAETDRVAALEAKAKAREEEISKAEQEINVKLAMLKKVEEQVAAKSHSKSK